MKIAQYIDREVVLNILSQKNAPWDGYQKVADIRIADVVSKAAYDQVAWERNLAEEQLKSIGKSLGEKMDDIHPVKHGRWIKPTRVPDSMLDECSVCGFDCGAYTFNYCPNCGAKMDGDDMKEIKIKIDDYGYVYAEMPDGTIRQMLTDLFGNP